MISFKNKKHITTLLITTLLCVGCAGAKVPVSELTSISIVDHNNFSETISTKERLSQYSHVDFTKPAPYKKVVRVYKRDGKGDVKSILTNYYPNGQIKQSLTSINGRAHGDYYEWHPNGRLKLQAFLIGGNAELDTGAESSWLFEGIAQAWNEDGFLLAQIPYSKGELEGTALYYHPNGNIWKKVNNHKNVSEGTVDIYLEDGSLLQTTEFSLGIKNGKSTRYWNPTQIASQEVYSQGALVSGQYYNQKGVLISQVKNGSGIKSAFGKDYIREFQQIQKGEPNGEISSFNRKGKLIRTYHVKDGVKHGEETVFYETLDVKQPKIYAEWQNDHINGLVKTWYSNGILESQREMRNSVREGLSTAWYLDGNLMLIEEYQNNKLQKGQYFRRGEKKPYSRIIDGKGVATLFDAEGEFLNKYHYINGEPVDDQDIEE